ncbi:MAG TPA: aspartate/glutamate racemase family protein [Thermoanaerobaculia bacterium]|jgi:aspartate racemase|nr:aspartate/glutamate racemase family protein [Thermoanaerobaculia bacterium]
MKTIGLIGGMSWQSTIPYYRIINETVRDTAGGFHSAKIILFSVDFAEIEELQRAGRWEESGAQLAAAARTLEQAGADFLVIGTNTMHIVADQIAAAIGIPILHIADATATEVLAAGAQTVGLLGTRFTMEKDFYRRKLEDRGLTVLVPEKVDRDEVHRVIYDELVLGRIEDTSRTTYRRIVRDLVDRGAQAIIFGCTEIGLLIDQSDSPVPAFDTAAIHAQAAARFAMT